MALILLMTFSATAGNRCPNGPDEAITTTCSKLSAAATAYDVAVARVGVLEARIDTLVDEDLRLRTERDKESARASFLAAELDKPKEPRVIPWWLSDLAIGVGSASLAGGGFLLTQSLDAAIPAAVLTGGLIMLAVGVVGDWLEN